MQRALTRHDMVGSMGQVASAADNAAMESFFSLLQRNVLKPQLGPLDTAHGAVAEAARTQLAPPPRERPDVLVQVRSLRIGTSICIRII